MSWKTAYRSFYYANAEEPADIRLDPKTTALLVIDIQNTYLDGRTRRRKTRAGSPSSSACARRSSPTRRGWWPSAGSAASKSSSRASAA